MLSCDEFREWVSSASSEELKRIQKIQFKTKWKVSMKQIRVPEKYALAFRQLALDLHNEELEVLRKQQLSNKKPF